MWMIVLRDTRDQVFYLLIASNMDWFTPKTWDTVLVSDNKEKWFENIYLNTLPWWNIYPYNTVEWWDSERFKRWDHYTTNCWKYMKQLHKEEPKETLDWKVATIDGVDYLLTIKSNE